MAFDWIPMLLEVDQTESWRAVEQANGLRDKVIKGIHWIKPTQLCTPGQRTTIAIFRLATQEDANQIIRGGIFVEDKKVWGRKQVQEPRRCLKCQCFGKHKVGECRSIHNVCRHCRNHHRTSVCDIIDRDTFMCSNCMAAKNNKHLGHRVADRRCPIFLLQLGKMSKSRNDSKYKFYCTDDPSTWETSDIGEPDMHTTDTNSSWKGDQGRRGRGSGASNTKENGQWVGRKKGLQGNNEKLRQWYQSNGNPQTRQCGRHQKLCQR